MTLRKACAVLALLAFLPVLGTTGCSLFGGEVAAEVNGEKIYVKQVDEQFSQMQGQQNTFEGKQGKAMEKQFKQRILDKLVSDTLMMQEAEKLGVKPSEKEIDDRYKQVKKQFSSEAQFNDALQKAKLTPDRLRESIEQQLVQQQLMARVAKAKKITDKQIAEFYNKNKAQFTQPKKYHVVQILVAAKDKALAEKLYTQLRGGGDFAALAKKHSTDPQSKNRGGDIGFVSVGEVVPEFGTTMEKLKTGEISKPVKSTFGWHIMKVVGTQKAGQRSLTQVKDQIRMTIEQMDQRDAYNKWLEAARKKADIVDKGLYK